MTISATGISILSSSPDNPPRSAGRSAAGFTLVELLVVIAIIGIILTMATLTIGGDRRGDELARESQRFQALLELAQEQALLRSEEWAVQIEPDRYRFLVLAGEDWQPVPDDDDPVLRERELEQGTELDLELEGREADLKTSADYQPTVLLLSSGEVTPFVLIFTADETERRFRVTGNLLGRLEWEAVYD